MIVFYTYLEGESFRILDRILARHTSGKGVGSITIAVYRWQQFLLYETLHGWRWPR